MKLGKVENPASISSRVRTSEIGMEVGVITDRKKKKISSPFSLINLW
jgi:hypothetical protein